MDDPFPPGHPAILFLEEGGGSFQRPNVAAVSQFRLGVAPYHPPIPTQWQPRRLLLGIAQCEYVRNEHDPMQRRWEWIVGTCRYQRLKFGRRYDLPLHRRRGGGTLAPTIIAIIPGGAYPRGPAQLDQSNEFRQRPYVSIRPMQVIIIVVAECTGIVFYYPTLEFPSTKSGFRVVAIEEVRYGIWIEG
jgi:hypothetical protein